MRNTPLRPTFARATRRPRLFDLSVTKRRSTGAADQAPVGDAHEPHAARALEDVDEHEAALRALQRLLGGDLGGAAARDAVGADRRLAEHGVEERHAAERERDVQRAAGAGAPAVRVSSPGRTVSCPTWAGSVIGGSAASAVCSGPTSAAGQRGAAGQRDLRRVEREGEIVCAPVTGIAWSSDPDATSRPRTRRPVVAEVAVSVGRPPVQRPVALLVADETASSSAAA